MARFESAWALLDGLGSLVLRSRAHLWAHVEGHLWTLAPKALWRLRPTPLERPQAWSTTIDDPDMGAVRLSGELHRCEPATSPWAKSQEPERSTLVIAIHGLGGDIDSHYMHRAAIAARAQGLDCLRLNLRGADLSGCDYYHAGLLDDLDAAASSEALASYSDLVLLGYSLGGHVALAYAASPRADRRLRAVAAVCPPLDLSRAIADIDHGARWPYRRYVLGALKQMLAPMAARGRLCVPLAEAMRIATLRDWDAQLVVPRYGFGNVDRYYREQSVAPRLTSLRVPSLVVGAKNDPMVLAKSIESALSDHGKPELLDVHWLDRAGHVGFRADASLGVEGPTGLEPQAIAWLRTHIQ